ncbi:hypothetical protein F4808DRAFT_438245 [Astrocystis sublimbata]|nr:hypothetical protein F4808DRAFT_438245 [Astrocystis sublimbata]
MKVIHLFNAVLLFTMAEGLNIFERQTDVCKWSLAPDDCICMNSMNGSNMKDLTAVCCGNMGRKMSNLKCPVGHDIRQTFKDCCKWLNFEHCIGHCR